MRFSEADPRDNHRSKAGDLIFEQIAKIFRNYGRGKKKEEIETGIQTLRRIYTEARQTSQQTRQQRPQGGISEHSKELARKRLQEYNNE